MKYRDISRLADLFYKQAQDAISSSPFASTFERAFLISPSNEEWSEWVNKNPNARMFLTKSWNVDLLDSSSQAMISNIGYTENFEDQLAVVSSSNKPPKYLNEINHSEILHGVGSIPRLFVFIGVKTDEKAVSSDIAHDYWLVKSLSWLLRLNEAASLNKVKSFYNENKTKINKVRSYFDVAYPKFLGMGIDGVAFDIGGDKVLKIFADHFAFKKAKEAEIRLHKNPILAKTEAMIYDVGVLGHENSKNFDVYYYIIEKMQPVQSGSVPYEIKRSLQFIMYGIKAGIEYSRRLQKIKKILRKKVDNPKKMQAINIIVKRYTQQILEGVKKEHMPSITTVSDGLSLQADWLERYIEEVLIKYLTFRLDLHIGNLGITNQGYLRYFDPANQGNYSDINV